ncbi:MAG TPA: hypothetical protein DCZ13_00245 [Porticoccaceae bacterium]|nr:hypothetical protein [Porticoccaceae bacterium]
MINLRENAAVTRHAEGNMIPVINMTFLLLLFFIVVGSFSENINQDISPPQSVTETMADPAVVEFELTREGQLLWQGEPTTVPAWAHGYRAEGLVLPGKVRLRADSDTPGAVFIPILDDFRFLHISRVALVTINRGDTL